MSLVASKDFQHILRVLNTHVDGKQKIMFALTSIKGIGRRFVPTLFAKRLMSTRTKELAKDYKDWKYSLVVSNALDMKLRDDLERLKKIKFASIPFYTGLCIFYSQQIHSLTIRNHCSLHHYWGLRVRRQHTEATGRRGKTVVGFSKKR